MRHPVTGIKGAKPRFSLAKMLAEEEAAQERKRKAKEKRKSAKPKLGR
jgi:hypothetical protein